jgi:hypothetical protein
MGNPDSQKTETGAQTGPKTPNRSRNLRQETRQETRELSSLATASAGASHSQSFESRLRLKPYDGPHSGNSSVSPQPLIRLSEVEASSRWYQRLLGCCAAAGPAGPAEGSPGREPGVNRPTSTEPRHGRKSPNLPPLPGLDHFFHFNPGSRPGLLSTAPPALMTATPWLP